jgi:hypothetical protein
MPAAYPNALKVFQVFHDYTDIIWAQNITEIQWEIVALESILGTSPFSSTPYTSVGGAIQDLYNNKAPINHTHTHKNLLDDTKGNDHPQYIEVTGYPGFSHPVTGKAGTNTNDLVPLGQLQGMGYQNSTQVQAAVNASLGNLMAGALGGAPLAGHASSPNWRIQGGLFSGCTDGSGRITVSFNPGYAHCVQGFASTKLPPQGSGGCPPYNWIESQQTLVGVSGSSATLQFSHDYSWQPNMWVSFTWIVIGN